MSTAIRLVRCPKCRKILPELPNILLYKCGGCGAILQAKKHRNEIKGTVIRSQETDPIQKHEPNSVSSSSSPEGDHPSIESSPGTDERREQFSSGSDKSEKHVDSNFSDEHSQLTKPNYLHDEKSSPETKESAAHHERERQLDQDAGLHNTEPLHNSRENPHGRPSDELSDYSHSPHKREDSSSEISNPGKQSEERCSPKLNVVTSDIEIEDSHGMLAAEEKCTDEPKILDQHSVGKNLMDVEKERQNFGGHTSEAEGSHGVLEKEERCSGEPQSLYDPETTSSPESEPLKLVVTKKLKNTGNRVGKYTNNMEDSQGDSSEEGSHSNESQSFDEPATHSSANESLRSDEENEPSAEAKEDSKVDERNFSSRKNDKMREKAFPDQIEEFSQKRETEKKASSSMKDFHKVEISLLVAEEYSVPEENVRSNLEKPSSPEKDEEITPVRDSSSRSIVFAPVSPDDEYLKACHEISSSSPHICSEEMFDTSPRNPIVPIAPLYSEDTCLEDSHEVGPSFHRISSEEVFDTSPRNPIVLTAPLSSEDTCLEDSHEVGPSFHRISSEEVFDTSPRNPIVLAAQLSSEDTCLEDSHEVGRSFHRISSYEMSDTLPSNPIVPIAPLSSDDIFLEDSHEVGPSFPRISSDEMSDTLPSNRVVPIAPLSSDDIYLEDSHEVGPSFHRVSSEEILNTLSINPRVPIAPQSADDIYLKGSHDVGPGFHRISSDEMLDTLPINPKFPIAPHSPDDTYMEDSHGVRPSFHRISSEEMFDTLSVNPRAPIGSMGKSPTKTYYSGDESESLYDGAEEFSAQVSHLYSRKFKGTSIMNTNRSRQKDGFRVKNKQNGELQVHNEKFNLLSKFKEPNSSSVSERDWRRHEPPEPRKHSRPIRTSMIATNNESISWGSFMPKSSQLFQGNGSPVNSTHNFFMHDGKFRQPDTMLGSPEKNELLRMVYELEDKISRTHMLKQMSGERFPFRDVGEKIRTDRYYDYPATERNSYVDIQYSGHRSSHPQGVGWSNQPRSSRLGFSGEALCRNHIDCRCSHCFHQDLHFSPKLSSHCIHCQHAAPPRHDYDNLYPSYSPSPQHYTSSEFSHEMQADNRKHNHETEILYQREKHQVMKRHLRPVSGGAPIISCYHCLELLQLPADFLLFRRRCHQLRCNSCIMILKFSLQKDSHLVPYVFKIQALPPSVMDDYSNIADKRTLASTSHAKTPQDARPVSFSDDFEPSHAKTPQDARPVSFSDDFEPSFSRNGSTESGPSVPSSLSRPKNLSNGEPSSNHTSQAMNDRKMKTVMEIYQDVNKSSSCEIEAAGPSSSTSTLVKPSTEIEELPATSCPPLHRLMGYESPRQVLFARSEDESDEGMGYYMDQQIR